MVRLRQAGAFLRKSKFARTLPVTSVASAGRLRLGQGGYSGQEHSNGLTRLFKGEQMTTQTKSLDDRLGGLDAINAVVDSWVARRGAMTGPTGSSSGRTSRGACRSSVRPKWMSGKRFTYHPTGTFPATG